MTTTTINTDKEGFSIGMLLSKFLNCDSRLNKDSTLLFNLKYQVNQMASLNNEMFYKTNEYALSKNIFVQECTLPGRT